MPLQVSGVLEALTSNWLLALGLVAVGLLAFWTFQERENDGSTVENVGDRADDFFGNLLGGFGSLVVVVLTILTTIGAQLVDLTEMLVALASNGPPLFLVNLAGVIVGALGLSGAVDVSAVAWVIGGTVLLIIGMAVRRRRMRGSSA